MPRFTHIQTNFTGGLWSPRLWGRVDLEKYRDALRNLLNAVVYPHGGWTRRPGTIVMANTKANAKPREFKFDYSDIDAYKLEFTNMVMRVYKNHALIESSPGVPLEVATVYPTAVLQELYMVQSNDTLYIFHENYPTKKLRRTDDTTWTFTDVQWIDGPYLDTNIEDTTVTPSAVTGSTVTLTFSSTTGVNGGAGFTSADVGRWVRANRAGVWGYGQIVSVTDSTHVVVFVEKDFKDTTATSEWRLSAFSSTLGYPAVGVLHEGRMVITLGQDIWGSISGDFETFSPTSDKTTVNADNTTTVQSAVTDGDSYHYRISPDTATNIRWMVSSTVLFLGTQGGEYIMRASSTEAGITPTNVQVVQISAFGSARIQPIKTNNAAIFVQRFRRKILELVYSSTDLQYKVTDLTLYAEHITKTGISSIAYQQEPNSIIWAARDDGQFIGLTYNRDENVFAFHEHSIGKLADGSTPAVETVCCLPNNTTGETELQMTVRIDDERFACYMREYFNTNLGHVKADAYFVDLGKAYSGTATDILHVGAHLAGQVVDVLADGSVKKELTVDSSGDVTLDRTTQKAAVGLRYRSLATTQSLEAGQSEGTAQGKKKKLTGVRLMVYDSLGAFATPDIDDPELYEMIEFTDGNTQPVLDMTAPLYTGITQPIDWPDDWQEEMTITIFTDAPLPFTCLNIVDKGITNEGCA